MSWTSAYNDQCCMQNPSYQHCLHFPWTDNRKQKSESFVKVSRSLRRPEEAILVSWVTIIRTLGLCWLNEVDGRVDACLGETRQG
jgi:hypothetical protein